MRGEEHSGPSIVEGPVRREGDLAVVVQKACVNDGAGLGRGMKFDAPGGAVLEKC